MPTRRVPRLGLGARGQSAADDSDNFKAAFSCREGDEPTVLVVSLSTAVLAPTAAQVAGRGRLAIYVRRNVDQDIPNGISGDTTGKEMDGGGDLIGDWEVGVTQGAASPHPILLDGIEMQDGDSIVVEGGKGVDNAGAGFIAVWGITVMGKRKRQKKENTR